MEDTTTFRARETRDYLLKRGRDKGAIVPFAYRPFDVRWVYWEPDTRLLDRSRNEYFPHVFDGNLWLAAAQHHRRGFDPPAVVHHLGCLHLDERSTSLFPVFLASQGHPQNLFSSVTNEAQPNLSRHTESFLASVQSTVEDLFFHCSAVLYSSVYGERNAYTLRQDWPRIPLPRTREGFQASAELGRRIAALLDTETPVDVDPRLKEIAVMSKVGGGGLDPNAGHLDMTVGWGHAGKGGVCMPGAGKIEVRVQEDDDLRQGLGEETLDVYLNEHAYWANIPKSVWEYRIGGYQVIKKWLSYREKALLGRGLKIKEAEYVTEMAQRIASLILMQDHLNTNYEAVKADTYHWPNDEPSQ